MRGCALLVWLAGGAVALAQRGTPEFQDEISERTNRALPPVNRPSAAAAAFQDSVWSAQPRVARGGVAGDASSRPPSGDDGVPASARALADDTRSLYREPFQLGVGDVSDDDLAALVAAAGDRVLAALKKADPRHDGRLRGSDIAR